MSNIFTDRIKRTNEMICAFSCIYEYAYKRKDKMEMKIRRDLEVSFETWKAMINGCTEATVGVNFAKRGEMPVTPNIRDCAEKYLADNTTETELVSETGTRKPTNRGDRRKETAKAKRRLANIYKRPFHNDSVRAITRNGKEVAYVKEGDTWSWRKEWRRMNHRIRRHEGKRECYLYVPEVTETETEAEIREPEAITPADLYNAAYEFMMEKDLLNEFFDYLYKRY